jgi:hypothetical protein
MNGLILASSTLSADKPSPLGIRAGGMYGTLTGAG